MNALNADEVSRNCQLCTITRGSIGKQEDNSSTVKEEIHYYDAH